MTTSTSTTKMQQSPTEESATSLETNLLVDDLIDQMQARFTDIGNSILGRMEEFDQRMDALESSIATLMDKAGLEHNLKREPSSTNAEVAKHRSSPESMEI